MWWSRSLLPIGRGWWAGVQSVCDASRMGPGRSALFLVTSLFLSNFNLQLTKFPGTERVMRVLLFPLFTTLLNFLLHLPLYPLIRRTSVLPFSLSLSLSLSLFPILIAYLMRPAC